VAKPASAKPMAPRSDTDRFIGAPGWRRLGASIQALARPLVGSGQGACVTPSVMSPPVAKWNGPPRARSSQIALSPEAVVKRTE
jgi:hypothetical protein